jgi:hypothetical protein
MKGFKEGLLRAKSLLEVLVMLFPCPKKSISILGDMLSPLNPPRGTLFLYKNIFEEGV